MTKSIKKAITWRIVATGITGLVVYGFTGEMKLAAGASLVDAIIKFVAYVVHERMWEGKW